MTNIFNMFSIVDYAVSILCIFIFISGIIIHIHINKQGLLRKDYSGIFLIILGALGPISSIEYAHRKIESQDYKYLIYTGDDYEYIHYTNDYSINSNNEITFNNTASNHFKIQNNKYYTANK